MENNCAYFLTRGEQYLSEISLHMSRLNTEAGWRSGRQGLTYTIGVNNMFAYDGIKSHGQPWYCLFVSEDTCLSTRRKK